MRYISYGAFTCAAMLLLVACGSPAQPTAEVRPTATTTPTPASGGRAVDEESVKRMAAAWAAAKSYRIKVEGAEGGQTITMQMEFVRPDREHISMSMGDLGAIEVIRIGSDSYLKQGPGPWTKVPGQAAAPVGVDPQSMVNSFNEDVKKGNVVTKGGLGLVDGAPCQEWNFKEGSICLGSDSLPRQMKAKDGTMTMTFSDWNGNITISPPL